jgi:hypothetical protein
LTLAAEVTQHDTAGLGSGTPEGNITPVLVQHERVLSTASMDGAPNLRQIEALLAFMTWKRSNAWESDIVPRRHWLLGARLAFQNSFPSQL